MTKLNISCGLDTEVTCILNFFSSKKALERAPFIPNIDIDLIKQLMGSNGVISADLKQKLKDSINSRFIQVKPLVERAKSIISINNAKLNLIETITGLSFKNEYNCNISFFGIVGGFNEKTNSINVYLCNDINRVVHHELIHLNIEPLRNKIKDFDFYNEILVELLLESIGYEKKFQGKDYEAAWIQLGKPKITNHPDFDALIQKLQSVD